MKNLQKQIKKTLLETKRIKDDQLIENTIIESRLLMVAEKNKFQNFDKLSESQKNRIADSLLVEFVELSKLGLISEQDEGGFVGLLKSIFGQSLSGIWQSVLERMTNWLLTSLGMEDSFIKKVLISYISSHPIDAIKALGDCKLMTKLLVNALLEGLIMEYKQSKGVTGIVADTLRNAVLEAFDNTETAKKLTEALSSTVCDLVDKLMGNAKGVLSSLQSKPATAS